MEAMNMKRIYLILVLVVATAVMAVEDPPNCSFANGGLGNTSYGGINFTLSQAHVGDTVSVVASLGMANNACFAVNATGSVYISTGLLTNFMVNVTLNPSNTFSSCPGTNVNCEPGPYSFIVTSGMVGAGVSSPLGSIPGFANRIRAIENGTGIVNSHPDLNDNLADFHSASQLVIVNPCIEVMKTSVGCMGEDVQFTGYVRNCGDITLTNVNVVDDRTASLFEPDGDPLPLPLTITAGTAVYFKGSFTPFAEETTTATNSITVTGRDTTTIGGPSAFVTNSVTAICSITDCSNTNCSCPFLILNDPIRRKQVEPMDNFHRYASLTKRTTP